MSAMAPIRLLLADPPWTFGDKLPGDTRGAAKNYDVMDLEAIKRFPLPPLANDALLLMWRVSSQVEEAYAVARAWGFNPAKGEFVWNKLTKHGKPFFGMGHIVRGAHETCLIATRGRFKADSRSVRSTFEAPVREHSVKPDEFYDIAEALCKDGPWCELFARRVRPGWTQYGNHLPGGQAAPSVPVPACSKCSAALSSDDVDNGATVHAACWP